MYRFLVATWSVLLVDRFHAFDRKVHRMVEAIDASSLVASDDPLVDLASYSKVTCRLLCQVCVDQLQPTIESNAFTTPMPLVMIPLLVAVSVIAVFRLSPHCANVCTLSLMCVDDIVCVVNVCVHTIRRLHSDALEVMCVLRHDRI